MAKAHKWIAVSELEVRVERAKEILEFIIKANADEGIHDNDVERVYNVLAHGAKYARMYRRKKD